MARTVYIFTALTGGSATALDSVDGNALLDSDVAFVFTVPTADTAYMYVLDDNSGAAESSPNVIAPDTNPGNKRWLLQNLAVKSTTITGLTSGRVPFASTGGLLVDDADMTFSVDTLTVAKFIASTAIADNTSTTQLATTAYAKSQDALLVREPNQGVALTAGASGAGIVVTSNDNINFGTGNFTLVWKGSLPDWTPAAGQLLMIKDNVTTAGYQMFVHTDGTIGTYVRSIPHAYYSSVAPSITDGTVAEIVMVVINGTSFAFFANGVQLGPPVSVASNLTTSTSPLDILGFTYDGTRYTGTVHHAYLFNRALSAAEVLDLYRNGVAESDKWGSQTSQVVNGDMELDSEWINYSSGVGTRSNEQAHSGTYSRKVVSDTQYVGIVNSTTYTIVAGKNYEAIAWVYGDGTNKIRPYIEADTTYNPPEYTGATGYAYPASWYQVIIRFTPSASSSNVRFYFMTGGGYAATFYVDDVSFKEIGATLALEPEGIGNGVWYDSTSNNLNATMPASGWSLTRSNKNKPVLTNLLTNTQWMAMSGSTLENVGSNLDTNGEMTTNTDGYTASNTTLSRADSSSDPGDDSTGHGASDKWALKIVDAGASAYAYYAITTEVGKLYKATGIYYVPSSNVQTNGSIQIKTSGGTLITYVAETLTEDAWTAFSTVFEATTTATRLVFNTPTDTNDVMYVDNVTLYEVTPGYVAADNVAPDGWDKQASIGYPDVWREHYGTNTKDGSFYAIKAIANATNDNVYFIWPDQYHYSLESHYSKFRGRTVTIGAWVKSNVASKTRLFINDGAWYYSSYHSGGNTYEWLELTTSVSSSATTFRVGFYIESNNPSVITYFSQPMLVYGSSIGQGNYQPIPNEVIMFQNAAKTLTGYDNASSVSTATPSLEAISDGQIGKGVKGIYAQLLFENTAPEVLMQLDEGGSIKPAIGAYSQVSGVRTTTHGFVGCDSNGDVRIYFSSADCTSIYVNVRGIQT